MEIRKTNHDPFTGHLQTHRLRTILLAWQIFIWVLQDFGRSVTLTTLPRETLRKGVPGGRGKGEGLEVEGRRVSVEYLYPGNRCRWVCKNETPKIKKQRTEG